MESISELPSLCFIDGEEAKAGISTDCKRKSPMIVNKGLYSCEERTGEFLNPKLGIMGTFNSSLVELKHILFFLQCI
jgi:hypothetical protein